MKVTVLEILNEVEVRFHNLAPEIRRKLVEQSKYYVPGAKFMPAVRLGRWDGKVSFFDLAGRTYFNFMDNIIPTLIEDGWEIEIMDNRKPIKIEFDPVDENSYSHAIWPEDHATMPNQPIVLRDYQVTMINAFLSNPTGVCIASTGSGKTLSTAVMCDKISKYGRSILIVPSKDLVTQTERDFKLLGLDVGVFFGDRKEFGKTHTICTWQSLDVLLKRTKNKTAPITIDEFLDNVAGVVVDEVHLVKGASLSGLLTGPFADIPIRWGVTGTIPKDDVAKITIQNTLGFELGKVTAKELQDKGVLSELHIEILQLEDIENLGDYHAELAYLTSNDARLKFLAKKFEDIAETGNTLILVNRIETGKQLAKLIPNSVFLSGVTKSKDRKAEYDTVKTEDGKTIIATFGIASTGIDIGRVFNVILFEPGKSFVRVIQSIGRGIRKAHDKDFVQIFDVCSTAKYSKKHLTERRKFYRESQYPFTSNKVKW